LPHAGLPDVVAPLLTVFLSPLAGRIGSHSVIFNLFVSKVVPAALLGVFLFGSDFTLSYRAPFYVMLIGLFGCLSRCVTQATFSFFNMSVADLIDEDFITYRRREPMPSMFFGVNALITKPAQSLAPVMTIWALSQYGYVPPGAQSAAASATAHSKRNPWGGAEYASLRTAMTLQLIFVPLVCTAAQMLIWRRCNALTGEALSKMKRGARNGSAANGEC
jgi:Na+/melibiose symporter-like transporter